MKKGSFPEIQDENCAVWCGSANLVAPAVPTNFEDASCAFVTVDQLAGVGAPDVDAVVEGSACQELAVGGERDGVDGFLVSG